MPSATIRAITGLATAPNPFSAVADGALLIGDECTLVAPNVMESRRGKKYTTPFAADRCFPLVTQSWAFCTGRSVANPLFYFPDTDTTFTLARSSGPFAMQYPYSFDIRTSLQAVNARGNIYFTTAQGIQCAPELSAAGWRCAGLPRPWISGITLDATPPLVMTNNSRRTYRATLAMYDELGNFLESEPSEPFYVDNIAGAARRVVVQVVAPSATPPGVFVRLWRSFEVPNGQLGSDEMYLVAQSNFGSVLGADNFLSLTDAGNNLLIIDSTPGDLNSVATSLTLPLYTNSRFEGIQNINRAPPAGPCIAYFKNRLYVGRRTFRQSLQIQIIGTSTTGNTGVQSGDVLTLTGGGFVDTFLAGTDFAVATAGNPAQNIEQTARNLALAINNNYSAGVYNTQRSILRRLRAQYVSLGTNDFGRINIERIFPISSQDDPGIGFTFSTTGDGITYPNGIQSSTDNYLPGGLSWSKPDKPEAFPPVNDAVLGDARAAVLGFAVHRDFMQIFKEDGTFIVRDDGGPQPIFTTLDPSVKCIAPASIAVVDNVAYCLTTRGLLYCTETGTLPIGEAVRKDVTDAISSSQSQMAQAFAIGYDSERLYVLAIPASATEQAASQQYVLRVGDAGFPPQFPRLTRWLNAGALHGMVTTQTGSPNSNKLFWVFNARPDGFNLLNVPTQGGYLERKGGVVSTDFVDFIGSIANPMGNINTNVLTFPRDVHYEIFPGDLFTYNPSGIGTTIHTMRVLSVDAGNVTLDNSYPFSIGGTFTYYRGIQARWRHTAITLGEPTAEKLWSSGQLFFTYLDADFILGLLDSEKSGARAFSLIATDPLASLQGGTVYTATGLPGQAQLPGPDSPSSPAFSTQLFRNSKNVILRLDPAVAEARGAALGAEFIAPCALSSFRLTAGSFYADEYKETDLR